MRTLPSDPQLLGHMRHRPILTDRPFHSQTTTMRIQTSVGVGHRTSWLRSRPHSSAAQADALMALVDALEVERVPVVGMSGGGPATCCLAGL